MMEFLVKAVLALEAGFKGNFIIPPNPSSMGLITESLQMIGVDPSRIVTYDGRPWWVEELFVPQYINGHHEISLFPGLMEILREKTSVVCKRLRVCPSTHLPHARKSR